MTIPLSDIFDLIYQFVLPFFRIGAMLMAVPVLGARIVPVRVRLVLSLMVVMAVAPILKLSVDVPLLSLAMFLLIVKELVIGYAIGFCFQLLFQVFSITGQLIAMKMGLGFAMMNDPANGVQTTVLSQFFIILCTIFFVMMDGHLYLIETIVESFKTFPPGNAAFGPDEFHRVVALASWMFASSVVFSLPVITALLFINIAFGVMSRAAPQLNIFAVGFPFTLICGLLLMWLGLRDFLGTFNQQTASVFELVHQLLRLR